MPSCWQERKLLKIGKSLRFCIVMFGNGCMGGSETEEVRFMWKEDRVSDCLGRTLDRCDDRKARLSSMGLIVATGVQRLGKVATSKI